MLKSHRKMSIFENFHNQSLFVSLVGNKIKTILLKKNSVDGKEPMSEKKLYIWIYYMFMSCVFDNGIIPFILIYAYIHIYIKYIIILTHIYSIYMLKWFD